MTEVTGCAPGGFVEGTQPIKATLAATECVVAERAGVMVCVRAGHRGCDWKPITRQQAQVVVATLNEASKDLT